MNLVHDEFKSFKCEDCGETFHNDMAMKTHRIIKHIVQKVYECDICYKQFAFKESLHVHKEKKNCVRDLPILVPESYPKPKEIKVNFVLDFSNIKVRSPPEINSNSLQRSPSSPLTCTDCGRPFAKKALLVWHQRHVCK